MESNLALTIISLLWLPAAARKLLLYTFWWQTKEYRFDRIRVFLQTREGQKVFFPPLFWVKAFVALWAILALYLKLTSFLLALPIALIFLLEGVNFSQEIFKKTVRKPVFTLRTGQITGVGLLFVTVAIWAASSLFRLELLLLSDFLLPIFAPVGVLLSQPLVEISKRIEINRANRALLKNKKLKVVGVTGSYGKTSTKEFLATILAEHFAVAKTSGSENTEFGIARKVQANLGPQTQVFVAEMGAYKIGEIKKLCRIVPPQIGIITGISPQHLSLFGRPENIVKAKYELIEALPRDGTALFNGDSQELLGLAFQKRPQMTWIYSVGRPKAAFEKAVWADEVKLEKESLSFVLHFPHGEELQARVRLLGRHQVENVVGAATAAFVLGEPLAKIKKGISKIVSVARTMQLFKGPLGMRVIDDSFSANPEGFLAALDYLEEAKWGQKVVVTPGIIELGDASDKIHKNLGKRLKNVADQVILTSYDFIEPIQQGMGGEEKLVILKEPEKIIKLFESINLKADDVVLLEGRVPESLRKILIK